MEPVPRRVVLGVLLKSRRRSAVKKHIIASSARQKERKEEAHDSDVLAAKAVAKRLDVHARCAAIAAA